MLGKSSCIISELKIFVVNNWWLSTMYIYYWKSITPIIKIYKCRYIKMTGIVLFETEKIINYVGLFLFLLYNNKYYDLCIFIFVFYYFSLGPY